MFLVILIYRKASKDKMWTIWDESESFNGFSNLPNFTYDVGVIKGVINPSSNRKPRAIASSLLTKSTN